MRPKVLGGPAATFLAVSLLPSLATPLLAEGRGEGEDEKAAAILDRAHAALGEPEALARVENRVFEGTSSFTGAPEEGNFREVVAGFHQARIVAETPGLGRFEEGAGHGVVWEMNPFAGARTKEGKESWTALRRYGLACHTPWRRLYGDVRLLGEERIVVGAEPGTAHEVYRVSLTPRPLSCGPDDPDDPERTGGAGDDPGARAPSPDVWYVDRETYLPVRMDVEMPGPGGAPMMLEVEQTDWRPVDGILYPHRKRVTMMGMTWVQQYRTIRHDVDLAASTFDVPEKVRETMQATPRDEGPAPSSEIRIETIEERHVATIRTTCAPHEIGNTLAIVLPEISIHLTSTGARVSGAPFTRYHAYSADAVDLEAGIPVAEPIEPAGRIRPGTLPGGHAVSAWHVGPYEELSATHTAVTAWIAERGIETTGPLWEIYWTDPGIEPDPKKWRTQILVPCVPPGEE